MSEPWCRRTERLYQVISTFVLLFSVEAETVLTNLPLQVSSLVWRGSGHDAGVAETRLEQHPHHEDKEDAPDRRDDGGQVGRQEGTAEDNHNKVAL